MSVNSSFSSSMFNHCTNSMSTILISAFFITKTILLLPFFIPILYLGYQRWRQKRSFATMSHSDIFTYHLAVMELIGALGSLLYLCGLFTDLSDIMKVGFCLSAVSGYGETFLHLLTCVERYLAVVHPVTYLGLRQAGGVRIRNISIGCVWLMCFGWCAVSVLYFPAIASIENCILLAMSFIVVSFCSLSVLCVLIRRRPGDVGGDREQVDQSKRRAFHTMMVILGVLSLWFLGYCVCLVLSVAPLLSFNDGCLALASGLWLNLPSSLVLPLLFLHRVGKLPCCSCNAE